MKCPKCKLELQKVYQSLSSMLNKEQWESIKAGDYYCLNCKPDKGLKYKYWWKKDL